MDRDFIVAEIRRVAAEDGRPPGKGRFQRATGITESMWAGRHWVTWSDALAEAGFEPNRFNEALPDDHLLRSLATLTRELGRFPVQREIRLRRVQDPTFPSSNTFGRLGTKQEIVARLVAFCGDDPAWSDVAEICAPLLTVDKATPGRQQPAPADGFVYLLKSGRHYKLGRSNDADRRSYEVSLQLPERAVKVHVIRTDDPPGIEAYWHRRFADKRLNGEWFALGRDEIAAFKRRRFM